MAEYGGGVLTDAGRAVMIVTVAISDVLASAIIQFDLEPMTDVARVVDGIEVISSSIGDAGLDAGGREKEQCSGATCVYPQSQGNSVREFIGLHLIQVRWARKFLRSSVAFRSRFHSLSSRGAKLRKSIFFSGNQQKFWGNEA
jgi:hypothetical protein